MQRSARRIPYQLELTGPNDLLAIHEATLEVLSDTGVLFDLPEAVELLTSSGATIDGRGLVRIPPHLVQDAIASAPSSIPIYCRDGRQWMQLDRGLVYCGTGSDCPYIIDSETGQRRPARKRDIETYARLSDALPSIDFVMSMALASDSPAATADLHHFWAMVSNTVKPVCFTAALHKNLIRIADLAVGIAGSQQRLHERPFLIFYAMPSPPLRHSETALRNLIFCAQHSIPVVYGSGTAMGLTGPMAIAGGAVSSNCDVLAGLVVHQLAGRGAPFIYGTGVATLDMQTTIDAYGAPEHFLGDAVNAQLVNYYDLPSWGYAADSDSKMLDLQAGLEFVGATLMGMLSGLNLLHDVGYLESGLTASYESLLFGSEVVEFARRILQSVHVNEETLALETIKSVGPGGLFIMEEHTLKHFRDFWYSPLIDRRRYDDWANMGSLTMQDRLRSRVRELLTSHQPPPMDTSVAQSIETFIQECDREAASNA